MAFSARQVRYLLRGLKGGVSRAGDAINMGRGMGGTFSANTNLGDRLRTAGKNLRTVGEVAREVGPGFITGAPWALVGAHPPKRRVIGAAIGAVSGTAAALDSNRKDQKSSGRAMRGARVLGGALGGSVLGGHIGAITPALGRTAMRAVSNVREGHYGNLFGQAGTLAGAAGGAYIGTKGADKEAQKKFGRKATTGERIIRGAAGGFGGAMLGSWLGPMAKPMGADLFKAAGKSGAASKVKAAAGSVTNRGERVANYIRSARMARKARSVTPRSRAMVVYAGGR